jgi:hypothetical protein
VGDLVKVWRNKFGEPVMEEYQDREHNPVVEKLTYPNGDGRRKYYIKGDFILTGERTLEQLEESYPELRAAASEDPSTLESAFGITLLFLGVEKITYKTAWRIVSMEPYGTGAGSLVMKHVIFFHGDTPVPVGPDVRWSYHDIAWRWRIKKVSENLVLIIPVAEVLAEGATLGTATVTRIIAKKVAKKAAKELVRYGLRRVLRVILKVLSNTLVKGTVAALKAFADEITKKVVERTAAERVQMFSSKAAEPYNWGPTIKAAAAAAAAAFVGALLDAVRKEVFNKSVQEFAVNALGLAPDAIETKIKVYLLKSTINLFTTDAMDTFNSGIVAALKASIDANGNLDASKFASNLGTQLGRSLTSLFQGKLKGLIEGPADDLANLVSR